MQKMILGHLDKARYRTVFGRSTVEALLELPQKINFSFFRQWDHRFLLPEGLFRLLVLCFILVFDGVFGYRTICGRLSAPMRNRN